MKLNSELLQTDRLAPSGGVVHLLKALKDEGIDYSPIRRALGVDLTRLTPGNSRIRASQFIEAYAIALTLPVPGDFWLRLGNSFSVHNYHLELSNWIMTGKNFAEIMPTLNALYGFTGPTSQEFAYIESESPTGSQRLLRRPLDQLDTDDPAFQAHVELTAASMVRGFNMLLGEADLHFTFRFAYDAPDHASAYAAVLGDDISFGASATEALIPQHYLFQEFPSSDPEMHAFYAEQLGDLFYSTDDSERLVERVNSALVRGFPSMEQLCRTLNMGERALRRGLRKHGTSYRQLMLDAKMTRARHFLRHTDMGIEEIAHRLDYSDYANFRRAFRAHCELSPSEYRRSVVNDPD